MSSLRKLQDSTELPPTYTEHRTLDFKQERRFIVAVQVSFVAIALTFVGVALLATVPLGTDWSPLLVIPATLFACFIYMAAHEATHGVVLGLITNVKPSYAVRFPFLTTGSHAFLTRRSAVIVALAPSMLWGIVLVATLLILPQNYLLTVYIVLALNFAGSAGDYLEVLLVSRQEPTAMIQDDGGKVRVFLAGTFGPG